MVMAMTITMTMAQAINFSGGSTLKGDAGKSIKCALDVFKAL